MISPKQQKAILSLLGKDSVIEAARAAGVNPSTIFRWLQEENFASVYRQARFDCWQQSLAILTRASSVAAQTLQDICLDPEAPSTAKVSASRAILEHARACVETESLAVDVKKLMIDFDERHQRKVKAV
jgi:transposase-like protein